MTYTKEEMNNALNEGYNCEECQDQDDNCQECCPHDEHDHGICLDCGKDRTDDLVGDAEDAYEGDR